MIQDEIVELMRKERLRARNIRNLILFPIRLPILNYLMSSKKIYLQLREAVKQSPMP
jgi:hypothetical protein